MAFRLFFLEEFGKAFIPKSVRPKLRKYLLTAGVTEVPYRLYGWFFYLSVIITYILFVTQVYPVIKGAGAFRLALLSFFSWAGIQLGVIALIVLVYYLFTEQRIYIRTEKMEDVLDDFLHIVSENLKGGMTLEEALWDAAKPQFGVLSAEIRLVAKRVMTGEDITDALRVFMDKYKSIMLKRSFNLILQSIEGGGKLSDIIDRVIRVIVETKQLKKEMAATNMTYMIFISFVVVVVAPALFVLSNQFLVILANYAPGLGGGLEQGSVNLPLNIGKISVDPKIYRQFSVYAVGIIATFASMIISIIRTGSIRSGIKLVPIYVASSYLLFFLFSKGAEIIVKSYFGF